MNLLIYQLDFYFLQINSWIIFNDHLKEMYLQVYFHKRMAQKYLADNAHKTKLLELNPFQTKKSATSSNYWSKLIWNFALISKLKILICLALSLMFQIIKKISNILSVKLNSTMSPLSVICLSFVCDICICNLNKIFQNNYHLYRS